jgi:uncharacterized protein
MVESGDDNTKHRIEKDIEEFNESVKAVKSLPSYERVIELAKMYASDAKSYLDKGDLYTSFSCISYAHGLLDALKELERVK